jgi:hypothetical protein
MSREKTTVIVDAGSEEQRRRAPIAGALVPKLPLLATLSVIAGGTALPGERPLFSMTAGQDRRARVQSIHDRTGWVFARCREMVDTMTDVQIEAAVRQHEETARRSR